MSILNLRKSDFSPAFLCFAVALLFTIAYAVLVLRTPQSHEFGLACTLLCDDILLHRNNPQLLERPESPRTVVAHLFVCLDQVAFLRSLYGGTSLAAGRAAGAIYDE